jgi:hypothetical protein
MLFYETFVLLFWYSLWNLLDELYQYYFKDEEMSSQKYVIYNAVIATISIVLLYLHYKYNGKVSNK